MEGEKPSVELPQYQCQKKVRAAKIGAIHTADFGFGMVTLDLVTPVEARAGLGFEPAGKAVNCYAVDVSQAWRNRFKPEVGGYYVVYEDGYASFSPAKAFEEGYTLIHCDDAGPFVLRRLSVSQVERLIAHGIEMELRNDGLVKIPVAE